MQRLPFSLIPHPALADPIARAVQGELEYGAGTLRVRYRIEGDPARILLPAPRTPRFADELWRHTCLELFVAQTGSSAYVEFNFAPSGEWAAYAFGRYRERAPAGGERACVTPPACSHADDGLELSARLQPDRLALSGPLRLGLSAVIEAHDGALAYWALAHPAERPDFHHPAAQTLELDEIRN